MSKDKILLVEDEPDLLQTLAFNFENEGYKVAKALDGKEAMKFLEDDDSISLVILDLMLPDMSGLDICRHISCLLYTSPSPRDTEVSRMPSSA